ncbi:spore germination protein [Herbivorax sp. ANBcel31]|uniref:spore germination protein n=1 Tax=Herbivorax sp. ANBcel31 TaxID=3069754 RepID=UPI0027ADD34C|nr:spore germination protein [Herbivorax sp. ANBcel31]MDQ2086182.1 spore germination protein [Herbivorax sp. ANBcel31]
MSKFKKIMRDIVVFKEPEEKEAFILKETEEERKQLNDDTKSRDKEHKKKGLINKIFSSKKESSNKIEKADKVSKDIKENLEYIKKKYNYPDNGDLVIKKFEIVIKDKNLPAFFILFDGMSDSEMINTHVLKPLMLLSNVEVEGDTDDLAKYIRNHLISHNQVEMSKNMSDIIDEVNFGGGGLFIDGIDSAYACDVKGWMQRQVDRPTSEIVIRGPQEAFTEGLRVNTALIRKTLKDENLMVEDFEVGKRSKTPCSLLYLNDIVNKSLVEEARRRLEKINIDFILDSGELEQLLEDSTFLPAPQILATERPDRASSLITQGKLVVLMHGSPFALIMPITNSDLLHAPEDAYVRFPYSNLFRIVRLIAVILSLLLPGIYVAVTNYHHEMIPTDLLIAIEASREAVPFPSVVEILMMEFAFELIREAGVRIPGPIGPTLGIIGALILGQAAVAANIVSPILIIVVAVTGIGSFAVPSFALAFSFRILRFLYIILAALSGFLGITLGIFLHGIMLVNAKSFGVPFMAPFGPRTGDGIADQFLRSPIWKQEKRPDYLNVNKQEKQPKVSREWAKEDKKKH